MILGCFLSNAKKVKASASGGHWKANGKLDFFCDNFFTKKTFFHDRKSEMTEVGGP